MEGFLLNLTLNQLKYKVLSWFLQTIIVNMLNNEYVDENFNDLIVK